jgi:hypothetical protein
LVCLGESLDSFVLSERAARHCLAPPVRRTPCEVFAPGLLKPYNGPDETSRKN